MSNVVVRSGRGPDRVTTQDLAGLGVSTVHEAMGRTGLVGTHLRPIYPGARVAGRAVTVLTQAGDNLMIHAALELCREGDILVVSPMSPCTDGMFGDMLATAARAQGVAALVIDAGVRDVAELTAMGFPVWARAVSAQGTVKATPGSVNVPVVVGGVCIRPGDVVVADDDGVVVVPLEVCQDVVVAARRREKDESAKRVVFAGGALTVDVYGLRETLARLGVTYVDADTHDADTHDAHTAGTNGEMTTAGAAAPAGGKSEQ